MGRGFGPRISQKRVSSTMECILGPSVFESSYMGSVQRDGSLSEAAFQASCLLGGGVGFGLGSLQARGFGFEAARQCKRFLIPQVYEDTWGCENTASL